QIQNYSSKLSLEETPCDFTPFLATLYAWLKKHTGFLVLNPNAEGRNGKEKLAKQLINWLSSEHFKPADVSAASSSSSAPAHARDSIAHFYQLERLFEAMEQFQKNKIVLIAADIPADKKAAWLRACDYLQERLAETEPSVARLLAEDERLEEHLKGFEAGYKAWRENSYSDFITNFFVDWFAADDDVNKATRGKLFTTLADLYFREQPPEKAEHPVLYLSDELLGKWTEQADDAGLIHLEPYQVNRFALHALCYPPSTWTPQFREYANLLLAFIRTGFNEPDASIKIDFARDSYPESLCAQLEGLIAQYDNPNSVSSPAATLAVLTPNLISAAESFRTIHYLLAVPEASESLIKQVISNPGFNADARGGESLTPLYLAAEEGNVAVGAALIEFGADVNVRFKGRYSPLYVADEKQHHEMVRLLLDSGKIDVSASHFNGKISFYVAITSGHLHSAKRLLEQTPEGQRLTFIQTRDSRKSNVLYYSLDKPDSLKVILELIPEDQRLAVIKLTDFKSMSGLHYAIAQPEHLKALLQLIPEKQRFKAVMVAYKYGKMVLCEATAYPESLKTLLELIPEDRILEAVQKSNLAGQTVLHHAIVNPQSIKIILERVPEAQRFEAVMTMNINGFTVLQYATNNPESLKEILGLISEEQRREAVMISNKQGSTVLHFATNNPASLRVIIDLILEEQRYEAIMMTTEQGYTVLHSAAVNHESLNIILGIIPVDKRFEAVMATTTEGSTVLHFAVNSPQALKRILECIPAERRLDAVMLVNDDGWCVLSRVSMIHQSLEIVLQLIPEGQRYKAVNLMNKYGKTVMDYASAKPKSLNILHQLISALRQDYLSQNATP
ncbi:MAG: ankyrin repeat domain-containing protein, partial [Gammaproteobacteria bacterium]|nr:ankyrin repeat domain-containing protein [Gammaproteobacteria bacterium]